jgi:hypothetical protein
MAYMCTNKHLAKGATYLKLHMFPIPLGSTVLLVFPHCQDVVQRSLDERYIHDTTKLGTHAANRVHVPNYRLVRLGFHLRFQAHVQLLHSWFNPFLCWLKPHFQWWNRHNSRKEAQPFFCVSADEVVACWGCTYIHQRMISITPKWHTLTQVCFGIGVPEWRFHQKETM